MAGPMGYRNYRGRTPKWKVALAVVLVLVILAAIGVIALQQHIVYDETGTPHLPLFWQETPEQEGQEAPGEVELIIQKAEPPEITAFAAPEGPLTGESWAEAVARVELTPGPGYNAVAVTVKDGTGSVYFDSGAAASGSVETAEDTDAVLAELAGQTGTFYTIARLGCFRDPKAANDDVDALGLENTGGYIFYDGNNSQWLDPGKPAARQYLCDLAREAAELGFDELLLTDVGYPTEGKLDKIAYTGAEPLDEQIVGFLQEMKDTLEPYKVALSVELPERVVSGEADENAGLNLEKLAPLVDRIYAETTPERAERLAQRVSAVDSGTAFVAELPVYTADISGSCFIYS